jgi:nucleoside-diphosphate-sugar epimerase
VNALVTGGGGFIGSAIVRRLAAEGHAVRVLDNFLTGSSDRVDPAAELIEGDLREPDVVEKACADIDVVFHQGALRSVPKSVDQPLLATECNVLGTLNVLVAAQNQSVRRVVYASSSSVYGDTEEVQREDRMPNPRSPYAASKLAGEQYCQVWTRLHDLSTVSLRYFNVFGPGQNPESKYSAVFPAFVSALLAGRAPELHWDGEQTRDFTYIDDVVAANIAAASGGPALDGEVFNIAGGQPKTINEVLRAVSDAVGQWIEPTRTPRRPGDVRSTHADLTKAREVLGWVPAAQWETAVEATVRALR